ncbi:hypothetical protein EBZ80_09340 [bacterium]|nr:hypothetical protein [bacterium]
MWIRLHLREGIDIEVPDFIALDTAKCGGRQPNRWNMRSDWHDDHNDLDAFIDSAVRNWMQERMRAATADRPNGLLINGYIERPDQPKDMP